MHDLRANDREAVLLRYFEGLPLAEIGARLALRENAARMRIDRAIDRLRAALAKRGVTSTVAALTAALTARAVGIAPVGLPAKVGGVAFAAAAAGSGLSWGLLKLVGFMKANGLLGAGATVLLAGLILVPKWVTTETNQTVSASVASTPRKTTAALPSAAETVPSRDSTPEAAGATAINGMTIHIVANDTGKPMAGAKIDFTTRVKGQKGATKSTVMATDEGVCEIPVSRDTAGLQALTISSGTDGYVDTSFAWTPWRGERIPQSYVMRLARSVPIGGKVLDEEGKPVSGAEVVVSVPVPIPVPIENDSNSPHISTVGTEKAMTGLDGNWRINRFSQGDVPTLRFQATHPEYAVDGLLDTWENPDIAKQLLASNYVYRLDRGVAVSGIVVDTDGQPVPGVKLMVNSERRLRKTTNQSDGTFKLPGLKTGANVLRAEARGFAEVARNIDVTNNQEPMRLILQRGNIVRLRVLNADGLPVPKATVRTVSFNVFPSLGGASTKILLQNNQINKTTDADGRVAWNTASEGKLDFEVRASGYAMAGNILVGPDGEEHVVTLHTARTISANVRDAATGLPIAEFHVARIQVTTNRFGLGLSRAASLTYQNGIFLDPFQDTGATLRFKFEAEGYAAFVTDDVGPDAGKIQLDITLFPAAPTRVTVLTEDGHPAIQADIGLEMPGLIPVPIPGGLRRAPLGFTSYTNVFSTDGNGRFALPPDDEVTRVVAACPDGYAEATRASLETNPTMHLQPWGRIEGTLLSGGGAAAGRVFTLGSLGTKSTPRTIFDSFDAETDGDGHFAFPKVPPGELTMWKQQSLGTFRGYNQFGVPPVTVRPGKTTTLSFTFYTVTARLNLPAGVEMDTNWHISAIAYQPQLAEQGMSAVFDKSSDGTLVAKDVPPGNYTVRVKVSAPAAEGGEGRPLWMAEVPLNIPTEPQNGVVDAGEIILQPVQ